MLIQKTMQDRFVQQHMKHQREFYNYGFDVIEKFRVNGCVTNLDTDTQFMQIYKEAVLNLDKENQDASNGNHNNLYADKNNELWENHDPYAKLGKLGINCNVFKMGPLLINKPDKVLEAQSLSDNFYLDLLDCSKTSVLAVGLSKGVYLWKPTGEIHRIREAPNINSIKWCPTKSNIIGCGSKEGYVELWDVQMNKCLGKYEDHYSRVGALVWTNNCLYSGGKDSLIYSYDMRIGKKINRMKFHTQEVCSLKVNADESYFASGSNDKTLAVWSVKMQAKRRKPNFILNHNAAVKGIAWHPKKRGILASGGGTEDRKIRIWNALSNEVVKSVDTGSQVCNLMYLKNGQNLVSAHGFNKFETNVWDEYSMTKKYSLAGHTKRVLFLTAEPDHESLITGAGDQTIRFWKLPSKTESNRKQINNIMSIR